MSMTNEQMKKLFHNLLRANQYNAMMHRRIMQGQLIGFYHPAEGAFAPGVGACTFLNDDDNLSPHHRGHGIAHMLSKGIDIKYYLAEHTGKDTGCCKGRSAFHFSFPDKKVYMMSGYIGYNFGPSVGWGWAAKRRKKAETDRQKAETPTKKAFLTSLLKFSITPILVFPSHFRLNFYQLV